MSATHATTMPSAKPPSPMSRLFASAPVTTIEDLRRIAERRVPRMFYDYADSGSYTESTYRANESDFAKIKLRQRVAVDMSNRSLASTMVGESVGMPVALAPTGLTGMQHADGEIHAARAAAKAGVPFTLSTMSICSIEDVAENTDKPFWFQLYVMRDRGFIDRLIDRAKAAGCSALVLTLDLQIDPEDAELACRSGADALIVSNHGGRQLDGAMSSISALPAIVQAVGDRMEVLFDGGIRSGQDVLKAIALGAHGTFIGRAFLYGLGAGGEAGVTQCLDIIRKELDTTMALCGLRDIRDVDARILADTDGLVPRAQRATIERPERLAAE